PSWRREGNRRQKQPAFHRHAAQLCTQSLLFSDRTRFEGRMGQCASVFRENLAMRPFALEPPPPRRLIHYTPLRYPGGKGKLAAYIKQLIKENRLLDGEYVEPYAGGAAIALELLFHDYMLRVHINDLSRPVYAFWSSVLSQTDALCKLIRDTGLNLKSWDAQK